MDTPFQKTLIPEESARKIWSGWSLIDNTQKADAAGILDRYRKQQDDLGEPLWPSQHRDTQAASQRMRDLFSGFDKMEVAVSPYSEDPQADKAVHANVPFLSRAYGKEPQEIADRYDFYRDDYARQFYGLPSGTDDKTFYSLTAKKINEEHERSKVADDGIKAALRGEDMTAALSAWQLKAGLERVNDSSRFTTAYQKTRERSAEFDDFSNDLLTALESNTGMQKDGADVAPKASREQAGLFDEMMTQMAGMTPGQRRLIYAMVGAKAEAKGYDQKGFFAQMLSEVGKGVARLGDTLSTQGRTAGIVAINNPPRITGEFDLGPTPDKSEEQRRDEAAAISLNEAKGEIYNEIASVVSSEIDPVKPVLSWLNDDIESGLIKGPGAVLPFMAVSLVASPLAAGAIFAADFAEQNRRDLRSMGYNPTQARMIGLAAAPLQAGAESLSNMLQLGRFPAVQKALSVFTKPIGGGKGVAARYLLNTGISVGTEITEEQLQDNFVLPAVQSVMSALGEDVPQVPWDMYLNRASKQMPELFFTIAPLALVFGGVMTAGEVNLSKGLVTNQLWLEYAGYSSAQASEVRSQPDEDSQIAKARSLWGVRAGTATTMEAAAAKLAETEGRMGEDVTFRQQELERRGILPIMGRTDAGWRLTFTADGSTAEFASHDQANTARWQYAEDKLGKIHAVTREALAGLEKNMGAGRELAVEFKTEAKTAQGAVDEGGDAGQIQRRVEQGKVLGDVPLETTFDDAVALERATGESKDFLASLHILGSSKNEFKDGILRTTIKLYRGASVLTLTEEKLEGDAKIMLASDGGRDWLLPRLRAYEQASGDTLFRDVPDGELTDDDLVEAWSHLGQSYLVGRSSFGEPLQKKNLRRFLGYVMRSGLGGAMNAESEYWRAVAARAQRLSELKRAGKLGDDLTSELEKQLGIDSQEAHEAGVVAESESIAKEAGDPEAEAKETYSLRKPFDAPSFITKQFNKRIDQWQETGDAGRELIVLGKTPPVLRLAGADDLTMIVPPSLFDKVTKDEHSVSVEALRQLPQSLADPVAVFQSRRDGNAILVLTEFREEGKGPVVIAIHLNRKSGRTLEVNQVASMYGRSDSDIAAMLSEQPLYVNQQKRLAWERQAGKQYPGSGAPSQGKESIPGPADVVKWAETMSLKAGEFSAKIDALFSPFAASPEMRRTVGKLAHDRVLRELPKLQEILDSRDDATHGLATLEATHADDVARLRADLEIDEAEIRQNRDFELDGAKQEKARAVDKEKIRRQADNLLKKRRIQFERDLAELTDKKAKAEAKVNKELGATERQKLKSIMRVIDSALSAAPAEVRARVGGYFKLAGLTTDEAMLKEVERKIAKLDLELGEWLKKEGIAEIEALLKRGRPDAEAGKKSKGKDPDMHHLFAAAEKAKDMDAAAVDAEIASLDSLIASGTLSPAQEALAESQKGLVALVGDLENADAARVHAAAESLREIYNGAWLKWKLAQIAKREQRAGAKQSLRDDTGKDGTKRERQAMEKLMASLLHWPKKLWLSISSFYEVLSYSFGDTENIRALVDAERDASNQYEDEIQAFSDEVGHLFTEMAGDVLAGEKLRYQMSRRTIKTPSEDLSQFEAIQALLMWRQEDGRRHMEGMLGEDGKPVSSWHYDQAWIDEVESQLTPEARKVMAFIIDEYAGEYATLNPLYRERHGVNMPQHDNYSPLTVKPAQVKIGEVIDPVSGATISAGAILTPGSLRTRSRVAVAEPEFRDALQTLIGHKKQMAYWKAYYDLSVEANAILGNREVMNAVEAKAGAEAVTVLKKWLQLFAQGGNRDAAAGIEWYRTLNKAAGNAAVMALYGRVSTLLVQSIQLAATWLKMPTGAYLVRLGKLFSGQLDWCAAIKSDFIQRRFKTAPPLVRQAMEHLANANKPNMIKRLARGLGATLSGADALFTAGTYAMLLDYHRSFGQKLGLKGQALEDHARIEAERATEEIAQPTRMANRSYLENTFSSNPLARASFAFSSDARQKLAVVGWRLGNPKTAAKAVAFLAISNLMAEVLRNLWRDAKGDDDEKKWSPERLAHAAFVKPLTGFPGVAEFTGEGGVFSGVRYALHSVEDIYEGEGDLKDWMNLLKLLGYFNENAASLTGLANAGEEAAKVIVNAAGTQ